MKTLAANSLEFLRALSRRGTGWALLMLVAGLLATIELARREQHRADAAAAQAFAEECHEIQAKIGARLGAHEQILRGAAAYFAGSQDVTRAEWRAFVERQGVHQPLPGSTGLGFAELVPASRLEAHLRAIRRAGLPDYRIWPEGTRELYSSVTLLEPFSGRNLRAIGYDMLTEPTRRAALERARDEDIVTLTGKVRLVQETGEDLQAGTLMFVPVYRRETHPENVEQRRASLAGWVYSPFRMNDLLSAAIRRGSSATLPHLRLELFDGTAPDPAALLFDSLRSGDRAPVTEHGPTRTSSVEMFGRSWFLRFSTIPGLHAAANPSDAWTIFCTGSLISFLLAGLALSLGNTRHNARLLAARLTADLRESEARWAFAVEGSGDGVWDWDVATGKVKFSRRWKDMLGYAESEIGDGLEEWSSRVHPEDMPATMAAAEAHLAGRTTAYACEHRVRHKAGHWLWILDRGLVVNRDAAGRARRMVGTHSDISARKAAEAALRASEENYRLLFEGMLDGFALHEMIFDAAGWPVDYRFLSVNPAFERLTGLRAADIVGRTVLEVMPATEPGWIERYGHVVLSGEGIEFEEFSAVLGKHFEISAFRPRPGQFATVFIDITVSKRAEAALRDSEERFRVLFEDAPDAMLLADSGTGRITAANAAAGRLLGRPCTDLVGLNQAELHPPRAHESPQAMFARHVREAEALRRSVPIETSVVRPDGTEIPVEILAQTIRLHDQPTIIGTFRDITVRKKAQVALALSEERYRSILHASPDNITLTDLNGRLTMLSPAAFAMFGYESDAPFLHRSINDFIAPPDRERAAARLALKARGISTGPGEYRGLRRDGSTFDIEVNSDFIRDEAGQPTGIVFVVRDVAERKRTEQALRESEERFRKLLRDIPGVAVQGYALDGTTTYWNVASERLYGYSAEEALGRNLLDLIIPPEMTEGVRQSMAHMAATHEPIPSAELLLQRKDGSSVPVFSSHAIVQKARGGPELFCVDLDLTERKQAEAALRDSEARFRVLFEGAPDAMILADPATGRVIDANEAAGRLLGRPRAALVGLHQTELHPPRRHDFSQASFERHAANAEAIGHTDPVETNVLRPDGSEIPVEILAQTIHLHDQPTIIGTFRDITVRKEAEAALQASQEIIGGILNTIPARVFWKDKNLVYLGCNVAFAQDAGFADPQEIIGKDDFQMGWRNEAELYRADDRAVIGSGTSKLLIEETQTTPDGKTIVLLTNKVPLRNATGEITGLLGTYTDITKWKQAEAALRASEEQFRSYIEHSPMGVFLADDAGYYVGVNQAAARTTGYTESELLTLRVTDLAPLEASAAFDEHFQRLVQFGNSRGEVPFRRKDGSVGYWIVDAVRLSPNRVLGFTVETTERKEAEQQLAESRDLLANLARLVPGVVYQYRLYPDGRSAFPFASPGMHEIYEVSPAEVQADATPVFGRLHPDDAARVGAEIMESARTLEEFFCEFRVVLPHQGLRWRWCQAHPERTPDGGALWHGIISDITDRKEAELALQTSLHEKDALLKEVHHRVKNNLQVIMSLLRMEGRRSAQPDTKSVLGEMQGRIRSMALLHESLYRSGTFAAVDLAAYLTQLVTQAFRSAQTSPHAVRLELALTPVLVEMDQALPCGLLVNELVSNSLKHAFPAGRTGSVHVALQPVSGAPARWCLSVTDDGVGLPPDFEARRGHSLGLQLVGDLAGQLHGVLAFAPAPGGGTHIAITFAIAATPESARP